MVPTAVLSVTVDTVMVGEEQLDGFSLYYTLDRV